MIRKKYQKSPKKIRAKKPIIRAKKTHKSGEKTRKHFLVDFSLPRTTFFSTLLVAMMTQETWLVAFFRQ